MLHQAPGVRKLPDGLNSQRLEVVFPRTHVQSSSVMQPGSLLICAIYRTAFGFSTWLALSWGLLCSAGAEPTGLPKLGAVHRGTPEIDAAILKHSGASGESTDFFRSARAAFEQARTARFSEVPALSETAQRLGMRLTGGPMLGLSGEKDLALWVRTAQPAKVEVVVSAPDGERHFGPVESSLASDLTAVVKLHGLPGGNRFSYQVLVDGMAVPIPEGTAVCARPGDTEPTRILFGADFHKSGLANRQLLETMASRKASAALLIGDLAADDRREQVGLHRSDYLLRDLSPGWRRLAASTPICAIWDDHDYFDNDLSGVPKGFTVADRARVRAVWHENWVNPGRDFRSPDQGIECRTRVGPCDVILLDTRSHRTGAGRKNGFLGEKQMQWLLAEISSCKGPFIILTSGTMWSDAISNGKDSWGTWDPLARDRIFSALADKGLAVLLLSGDRHGARVMRIPWGKGFHFWEFELGSLGGHPGPAAQGKDPKNQPFGITETPLFGEFEFNGDKLQPTVTARIMNPTGAEIYSVALNQRDLIPKAARLKQK